MGTLCMGCSTAQHSPSLPVHSLPQTPLSSNPNLRRALTAFPPSTHPPTHPPTHLQANAEKQRLEHKQRAARKAAERGDPIRPRWFDFADPQQVRGSRAEASGSRWEASWEASQLNKPEGWPTYMGTPPYYADDHLYCLATLRPLQTSFVGEKHGGGGQLHKPGEEPVFK